MSITSKNLLELEISKLPLEPRNSREESDSNDDIGHATITDKPKLEQPPLYKVVLINDDYTPMDFVVDVLRSFFNLNIEKATQVMLKVHTEGKGVCGVYSKDVAETKAAQVNDYSRECEQPLLCSVEVDR
jgi:ATP-dependent Clp protease adaptor protein ClpS